MGAKDWAVVIAIGKYRKLPGLPRPNTEEIADLESPLPDAAAMVRWLLDPHGGDVPTSQILQSLSPAQPPFASSMFGEPEERIYEPTPDQVRRAFDKIHFLALASENEGRGYRVGRRLYVYASGHGVSPKRNETLLLTADATRSVAANFPIRAFAEYFFEAGAFEEVVLLVDACQEKSSAMPFPKPYSARTATKKGRIFEAFAVQFEKLAREKPIGGETHGVFTYTALQGLAGDPPGASEVTTTSLQAFIKQHMRDHLTAQDQLIPSLGTDPSFEELDTSPFTLVPRPAGAAPVAAVEIERVAPPVFGAPAGEQDLVALSPAPVWGAMLTHEYHLAAAGMSSDPPEKSDLGGGAGVFVLARDYRSFSGKAPPAATRPGAGLFLETLDGRAAVEIGATDEHDPGSPDPGRGWDRFSIRHVEVAPGPYLLRSRRGDIGPLAQVVVAPKGYQTLVFLVRRGEDAGVEPEIDPDWVSIHLSRIGVATSRFNPGDPATLAVERLRAALARGDRLARSDLLSVLERLPDPMAWLLAGNLLLRDGIHDIDHLKKTVDRLRDELGEAHPDVEALALAAGGNNRRFDVPPMLSESWRRIASRSQRDEGIVPAGSLAARIGPDRWGSGAWLAFRARALAPKSDRAFDPKRATLERSIVAWSLPPIDPIPLSERAPMHPEQLQAEGPSTARLAVAVPIAVAHAEAGIPLVTLREAAGRVRDLIALDPWPRGGLSGRDEIERHIEEVRAKVRNAEAVGAGLVAEAFRAREYVMNNRLLDASDGASPPALVKRALGLALRCREVSGAERLIAMLDPDEAKAPREILSRMAPRANEARSRLRVDGALALADLRDGRADGRGLLEDASTQSTSEALRLSATVCARAGRLDLAEMDALLAAVADPFPPESALLLAHVRSSRSGPRAGVATLESALDSGLPPRTPLLVHRARLDWNAWLFDRTGAPPVEAIREAMESAKADVTLPDRERDVSRLLVERLRSFIEGERKRHPRMQEEGLDGDALRSLLGRIEGLGGDAVLDLPVDRSEIAEAVAARLRGSRGAPPCLLDEKDMAEPLPAASAIRAVLDASKQPTPEESEPMEDLEPVDWDPPWI